MKKILLTLTTLIPVFGMIALSFVLQGCSNAYSKQSNNQLEWDGYQNWYHITKDGPNIGDLTGFVENKHNGPKGYREIYINKIGVPVHKGEKSIPYPAGTIIVKESYKNEKAWSAKKNPVLTIMKKLEKGTAPSTGDWEYIMGANGKKRGSGMKSKWGKFCHDCHINGANKDFVFMNKNFVDSLKK